MNSHTEIRRRLPAYCGGDLEPAERQLVEQHLSGCPACRAELADLQTALRLIRSTPEVDPPPWMTARVMARIRTQQAEKRSWLQRFFFPLQVKLPLEAIALLMICVSGYYLTRSVETSLEQTRQQQLREIPAQPAPSSIPSAIPTPSRVQQEEPQAPVPPPSAPQSPPQQDNSAVKTVPQMSSPPAPATNAPPPPHEEQQSGNVETLKAAPATEINNRELDAAPEKKMKSSRSLERAPEDALPADNNQATGAPIGLLLPQAAVRMSMKDPSAAADQIREALLRSGGSVVDERILSARRIKGRIPSDRQKELLGRLERSGTITEHPAPPPAGTRQLEITIQW